MNKRRINDITQVHLILSNIAKEFHEILCRNGIPYFMVGGTMLGAIRHKGFIPWDDDMDFAIPRPYYEKAKNILKKELSPRYKIASAEEGEVLGDSCKIIDTNTEIVENKSILKGQVRGLNIDIFPLDYCNNHWGKLSRNWWITILMAKNSLQFYKPTSKLDKTIAFVVCLLPKNTLLRIAHLMIRKDGDFMVNHGGIYAQKEIISKSVWGTPQLYQYEDTCFYGPSDYDNYLKGIYKNYMELPPVEKRRIHINECYVLGV